MTPGGTTEIIWHFAGYLHLAMEELRARLGYEEGPLKHKQSDYVAKLPDDDFLAGFTSINPLPVLSPEPPFEHQTVQGRLLPQELADKLAAIKQLKVPAPEDIEKLVKSGGGGGGGGGGKEEIRVIHGDGEGQVLSEINQLNMMSDDDQLGLAAPVDVQQIHDIDLGATLEELAKTAAAQVPAEIAAPQTGVHEVAAFLKAQDAITEESGGEDGSPPAAPGLYINGELQPAGATRPPAPVTEEQPPDLDAKGQWATLGGNIATNAALIVDLNEASASLMVLGDYFETNGIVQTNLFVDNDQVHLGALLPTEIVTGSNTATNIAEFIQNDGLHGAMAGNFGGPIWHVDIIEGDFYDINLLVQKNYLDDNDVTAQDGAEAHYQVVAGANGQYNLIDFLEALTKYDLIIIGGDYHGANLIFQTNILLDDDILKLVSGGDHPTAQFALTGENALLNDATIVTYGNNAFQPFTEDMDTLVAALAGRQSTLDPRFGELFPDNGGDVLNVLYITGDYYDINALWQINVIADLDLAIQLLSAQPDEGGAFTQSAATGGNQLTNFAGIIDVGSTFAFLKGNPYEDSILVQANLVTDDKDSVVPHDTNALVTEVIAFIGADDQEDNTTHGVAQTIPPHDDVMGNVLT